jgi:hypothetical protein
MCDRQHRESHAPLPGCTASAQPESDAVEASLQYEEPGQEREKDLRRSLHNLQEFVCELLIQNQELRMSLPASATSHKSREADQ